MKKGIHPKWNKEAKVIFNGKAVMTVGSTSDEINTEIWSGNHPFYTGQEILVDTDNLVEKFNKKLEEAKNKPTNSRARKLAKRRRAKTDSAAKTEVTLRDMLKDFK
ncbi:50S ribosomal protein L31 [Candidatus Dojkabacteria bacterium]|uniref:50S ribosomal protein L31 n=1 Tax=Candidatus Dojkabacteria bacterium TaxID=2099670 RepID=A0A955RL11_9BACT|nr:50S ribosomal protein L31 [Candidatus Dojkabacteria bacterium]